MNENRYYGVRVEGAKYGVGFGSALAIAISYTNNHSILWAIIHGILGWLYVIYVALFGSIASSPDQRHADLRPDSCAIRSSARPHPEEPRSGVSKDEWH